MNKAEILDAIAGLSVLELSELIGEMEEKFGVSAAPVAAVAAGPAPAADAAPEAEEQTAFDLVLSSIGDNKIAVIKTVRAITGLGLKEAKELVDAAPKPVKEGVAKDEAEEAQKKLQEAGATCEIK